MLGKHRNLIRQLPADGAFVTARELAARLGISARSVATYVGEITAEHPSLIKSSGMGYSLDGEKMRRIEFSGAHPPETSEQRALYMIRRILENEGETFGIEDFANELFIGESSLRKDLPAMRKKLREFDLFVEHRNGRLAISGDEFCKRRMLSEAILGEFNDNILSMSAIGKAFPAYDSGALKDIISEICGERRYFINGFALMNLVLDLIISMDRIKNNHLSLPPKEPGRFGKDERRLAQAIIQKLEPLYGVTFNQLETDELLLLLFSRLTKVDYSALTLENIKETVSAETLRIVGLIKSELGAQGFMDFENDDLMLYFTVHIDNLLWRLDKNYLTKNPLTEQIKNGCAFIYELAVMISGVINRETGRFVSRHETAYIAFHIGGMLQMQQSMRNKARCALVFPNYYDYANRLVEQLSQAFGSSLVIEAVVTRAEEAQRHKGADIILSTVDLENSGVAEVVRVNPFLSDADRAAVRNGIDRVVKKKKLERIRESLLEISSPDMFSLNMDFKNEKEAIRFMAARMISGGYADESFLDAVFEREKSYSTAYGDIAVPHSMRMDAAKTGMYVCINEKRVPWGEGGARIMLLFSVSPNDKTRFYDVFENLIVLLVEQANSRRVAKCKTYAQFVEAILSCLE